MKNYTIDNNGNMGSCDGAPLSDAERAQLRSMMNVRSDFVTAFNAGVYIECIVEAVTVNGVTAWGFHRKTGV